MNVAASMTLSLYPILIALADIFMESIITLPLTIYKSSFLNYTNFLKSKSIYFFKISIASAKPSL